MSGIIRKAVLFSCLILTLGLGQVAAKEINLYERLRESADAGKVHILYISASYCSFCMQLEEEVIGALVNNENYQNKVTVTEVKLDGGNLIIGLNNETTDADTLSYHYKARITPTLLFLDGKGREIAERRVGYQNENFYWYYLDQSINDGLKKLSATD